MRTYLFLSPLLMMVTLNTVNCGMKRLRSLSNSDFGPGDVIKTQKGQILAAISDTETVSASHQDKDVYVYTLPKKGINEKVEIIADEAEPGWNSSKRIALAKRLAGKLLPYSHISCRASDYMNYIVKGKTSKATFDSNCPLTRVLASVSVQDINSDDFYLESKKGRLLVKDLVTASI